MLERKHLLRLIFEKSMGFKRLPHLDPHHFARILDRGMKANRCLEWLEKASPQTPKLK